MKTVYLGLCLMLIAGLEGCGQQPQQAAQHEADVAKEEAAIRATDVQWLAAAKARDAESTATFWSDDATILMPNSAPVVGRQAIRAYVAESFRSPDFSITWTTYRVVVASSGDMAYGTGVDEITFRDGKQLVNAKNNALVIWKKQPDGRWKAAVDIATPAAPQAPLKK